MAVNAVKTAEAWDLLRAGNERFVRGELRHPGQGAVDRAKLVTGQQPSAILFGCSDSRVAAEIIFDQGLGDMFVVRTAGHVIDASVLGSIEYGVEVLGVPLIVVLGHDSCGAVRETIDALDGQGVPGGFIRSVVERVAPSILVGRREGLAGVDELEARHVVETSRLLTQRSAVVAARVAAGDCAIACVTYKLSDGRVQVHCAVGDIGETVCDTADPRLHLEPLVSGCRCSAA
ncbi:carbonic anhydrase [Nocardia seriolae]|uniref:carbonic anhydrase n=1 Tax=Nocardia seriolae TaxID=37332 RepID=A0ABC8B168_9NOCA|nr:carbonic anhydrase [Nocardia seriolae]APB00291.1 Carbonate dehydratase [Nocardia seriolae]OJF79373.1 carbonic anhydrase [Nocardia seriolae]PSK30451.1 carbonic anhydrase [Nocardia seriolae]QOW36721.1 carbonic anhydrase [Nocardia seriolae]QUN15764.1 carbonic anhydrase [Nocardia seriolae]